MTTSTKNKSIEIQNSPKIPKHAPVKCRNKMTGEIYYKIPNDVKYIDGVKFIKVYFHDKPGREPLYIRTDSLEKMPE